MNKEHPCKSDASSVSTDRAVQTPQKYVASIAAGGAILLVVLGLMTAGAFYPDQSSEPQSSPPEFQSQYTAQEIETAQKHELYGTFYDAQLIVVGNVAKLEGDTPEIPLLPGEKHEVYDMCVLSPTQSLYVNSEFAHKSDDYDLDRGVPDEDLNQTHYILAQSFGGRQTHLGRSSNEILQVANIAIEQRKHDDAVLLHLAKTDPASHPLFKAIRSAKNIATVDVVDHMAGGVSIDRAGNVKKWNERIDEQTHLVMLSKNFRGQLPKDSGYFSHLRIKKPLPSPVESQPLIVVWEMQNGRAQATHIETMSLATLRIASAAMKREFKDLAIDAKGPQSWSSRESRGTEGSDTVEDVPPNHHSTEPIGEFGEQH